MTTSNPAPDPVTEGSQTLHPTDPSLASVVAPQKQERDYLVIGLIIALMGLIIALMAIMVAGFFSLDSKIDVRIDALTTRIDALEATLSARIDELYKLILSPKA